MSVLREIGVPAALKRVASCPNDVASKLARKGLKLMDEDAPHRLSQQVIIHKQQNKTTTTTTTKTT